MSAPAGWYPDPTGRPARRYWDGAQWTEHFEHLAPTIAPELRAPEGTSPYTVWIWLVVFVPVLTIVTLVPMMLQFAQGYAEIFRVALANVPDPSQTDPHQLDDAIRQPLFAFFANDFAWIVVGQISGFVLLAVQVVFAWLDWRELGRRGVPRPFHWAWIVLGFAGAGNFVYVIGRIVVVRRRTGRGGGVTTAFVIVNAALLVVGFVLGGVMFAELLGAFRDLAVQHPTT